MDVRLLWAGVWFTAQNGDAESLLSGRACISQRSPLHPAAFRAGARPGSTETLRHWPESGGYGCAFRPAPGCTSGCGPFCGGAGCGWVFYCSFPCWSGHRILSGPWMQAA